MTHRRFFPFTLLALFIAIVSIGLVAKVRAQPQPIQADVSQQIVPSVEFDNTDVRQCLRSLFKMVNTSYSIAPEVQGTVTLSLKNVSFEVALQNVLRQVDATYRIRSGVHEIIKRSNEEVNLPDRVEETRRILPQPSTPAPATIAQDNHYLYLLVGKNLYKVKKSDLKVVATQTIGMASPGDGSPRL
jgi:bla regulator protein BlaR1